MMKKIYYTVLALALMLTGCNNEIIVHDGVGAGRGALQLNVDCESDLTEVVTKTDSRDVAVIDALVLDIYRPADDYRHDPITYKEVKEKGGIVELGTGSYKLTVSSPEKKDAGFDSPVYEAEKDFEIKLGEITNLGTVTCSIQNLKVSIELSESFMNELVNFDITVSNGKGNLTWTKESEFEERIVDGKKIYVAKQAGYFSVAPLTMTISGKRASDGSAAVKSYSIASVEAADHHIVKLDAKLTGNIGLDITINDKTNDTDQVVTVPGFDEDSVEGGNSGGSGDSGDSGDNSGSGDNGGSDATPADAPTLSWPANPTFADLELPKSGNATVSVNLVLSAPKGIREFIIYVDSDVLSKTIHAMTEAGEAGDEMENGIAVMDMINDEALYNNLGETLPMKDAVLNQTNVPLSLSSLVPYINIYKPAVGAKHIFKLHVVDNAGNVLEKTVTIVSVAA